MKVTEIIESLQRPDETDAEYLKRIKVKSWDEVWAARDPFKAFRTPS